HRYEFFGCSSDDTFSSVSVNLVQPILKKIVIIFKIDGCLSLSVNHTIPILLVSTQPMLVGHITEIIIDEWDDGMAFDIYDAIFTGREIVGCLGSNNKIGPNYA